MTPEAGPATFAAVGLGCALGAVLRFEISRRIVHRIGDAFPWGTLVVNLTGGFLAGLVHGGWGASDSAWMPFALAGVLGGYTTVSSFGLETVLLARRGRARSAVAYAGASLIGSPAAVAAGIAIASGLATHG